MRPLQTEQPLSQIRTADFSFLIARRTSRPKTRYYDESPLPVSIITRILEKSDNQVKMELCNEKGEIQIQIITPAYGMDVFHDSLEAEASDLWPYGSLTLRD